MQVGASEEQEARVSKEWVRRGLERGRAVRVVLVLIALIPLAVLVVRLMRHGWAWPDPVVLGLAGFLAALVCVFFVVQKLWVRLRLLADGSVEFERLNGETERIPASAVHAVLLDRRTYIKGRRPPAGGSQRYRYLWVVHGERGRRQYERRGSRVLFDEKGILDPLTVFHEPMTEPLHRIAEQLAAHVGVPVTQGRHWVWRRADGVADGEERCYVLRDDS